MAVLPASEQAAESEVRLCDVMVDRTEDVGEVDGTATLALGPDQTLSTRHDEKSKAADESKEDSTATPDKDAATGEEGLELSLQDAFSGLFFDQILLLCATFRLLLTIYFCGCIGTLIGSEKPTLQMFIQSNALTTLLPPALDTKFKQDSTIQFYEVHSVNDVYDWLTDTLIPTVFTTTDHTGALLPDYEHGRIGYANQVLGGVMLEMTSKTLEPCDSTEAFVGLYQTCVSDGESSSWSEFLDISLNVSEATDVITALKERGSWVSYHSKELRVTVATYNAEVDAFSVTRLTLNFLNSGTIELKASTESIPDYREQDVASVYVLGLVLLFGAIFLLYLELPGKALARQGTTTTTPTPGQRAKSTAYSIVKAVFKFGAIPVFFALLIQALTLDFDSDLSWLAYSTDSQDKFQALKELLESLDWAVVKLNWLGIAGAVTVIQLGFFVIRQMRFHPHLDVFARTVENSLRRFFGFFFVFMIIFLAFSLMGNSLFGKQVLQFSTPGKSMESCVNMLFGEFDYDNIREISASGLFYWGYMLVVSLVLLNMMLAIVMDAYGAMNKEVDKGLLSKLLVERIKNLWVNLYLELTGTKRGVFIVKLPKDHPARVKPSDDEKEAMERFKLLKFDARKLSREDLIMEGKVHPFLLLQVLVAIRRSEMDRTGDGASFQATILTPTYLRRLFPGCEIQDDEVRATLQFLQEGLKLYQFVKKRQEVSSKFINKLKAALAAEEEEADDTAVLAARMARLEDKLDKLLANRD